MDNKLSVKSGVSADGSHIDGFLFLGAAYGILMGSKGIWAGLDGPDECRGVRRFCAVSRGDVSDDCFNPVYALLMTIVINARHLFYGLSMLEKYRNGQAEALSDFRALTRRFRSSARPKRLRALIKLVLLLCHHTGSYLLGRRLGHRRPSRLYCVLQHQGTRLCADGALRRHICRSMADKTKPPARRNRRCLFGSMSSDFRAKSIHHPRHAGNSCRIDTFPQES